MNWIENVNDLSACLQSLSIRDRKGKEIEPHVAFRKWQTTTKRIYKNRKTAFLIGNGASASMASHIAADLAKNAHLHTEVFSDLSLITAIGNDLGYIEVFAEPLKHRMIKGDMLIAISSSGQSPNIILAAQQARALEGNIITLSAMRADNALRSQGMLNFYVPASTYGMAETCHAAILHWWVDLMTFSDSHLSQWKSRNMTPGSAEAVKTNPHYPNQNQVNSDGIVS